STNIDALGYVSTTNLFLNGNQFTGDLQSVTDVNNITDNPIGVAGVSTTGNILPTTSLTYDLGSTSNRWKDIWASSTYIGTSTWNLRQNASSFFTIAQAGGAERMTIDTSGNVGIGTINPQAKLDISGANSEVLFSTALASGQYNGLRYNAGDSFWRFGLKNYDGLVYGWRATLPSGDANRVFDVQGVNSAGTVISTYFRVRADGNVGIGETVPTAKLHLNSGSIRMGSQYDIKNTVDAGVGIMDVAAQGTVSQALRVIPGTAPAYNYLGETQASFFEFHRNSAGSDRLFLTAPTNASNGYQFVSYQATTPGPIRFGFSNNTASLPTYAMSIINSGNVGIGDTSPLALFTVGNGDLFQVSSTGNLAKIRGVDFVWPSSQGGSNTFLKNDGTGTLTWETVAGASTPSWQEVTDVGATTTNWVWFTGATSSGDLRPSTTLMYDLGTSQYRWDDIWGNMVHIGSSTWDLYQDDNQDFVIDNRGLANLDEFDNDDIEAYWTTSTPVGEFTESGDHLTGYCAGICDWYNGANESSPIIYQPLSGGDFIVTTKIDTYTGGASTNVGLTLYTDRNNAINWVRNTTGFYAWQLVSDAASSIGISGTATDLPLWLRLRRVGTTIYFEYSIDGYTFITSGSYTQPFNPANAGVFVKSWSGGITSTFDSFELNEDIAQVRISNTGTLLSGHNNGQDIGAFGNSWKNMYASGTYYGAYLDISGTSTLADIVPQSHNLYSLGLQGNAFKDIYASGTYNGTSLQLTNADAVDPIGVVGYASTTGSGVGDGVVVGDLLYVVDSTNLNIFDITDRLNPTLLGATSTINAQSVAVVDDIAYVADGSAGIRIIDVSNSALPVVLGSLDMTGQTCYDVKIKGNYAYLPCYSEGVRVVDISDPSSPVLANTYDPGGYAFGIDMKGDYIFVANGTGDPDMYILDISDPLNISLTGGVVGADYKSVTVQGDYAFLAEYDGGGADFDVVDISDPTSPSVLGSGATSGDGHDVVIGSDGYVYVSEGDAANDLGRWDVSNPSSPTKTLVYTPSHTLGHFISKDRYLYIAGSSNDIYVFDTGFKSTFIEPDLNLYQSIIQYGTDRPMLPIYGSGQIYFDSLLNKFQVSENGGDYYSLIQGLQDVTDVSNTTNDSIEITHSALQAVGNIQDSTYLNGAYDIRIVGNLAYTVGYELDWFSIWDLASSTNPVRLGSYADASYTDGPYNFEIDGNYAYIASELDNKVTVLDISSSTNITLVDDIVSNNGSGIYLDGAFAIKIKGDYAYVASQDDDALEIINISDPSNLTHVSSLVHNGTTILMDQPQALSIVGDYVYITGRISDSVQIVDISDPANPVAKGNITDSTCVGGASACALNGPGGIEVVDEYAYIAGYDDSGFTVIDVSSSTNPVNVGYLADTASTELNGAWDVQVYGDYAYVTGYGDNGVEVIDISDPTDPTHAAAISDSASTYLTDATALALGGEYLYVVSRTDDSIQVLKLNSRVKSVVSEAISMVSEQIYTSNAYATNNIIAGGDLIARGNLRGQELHVIGATTSFNGVEYYWPSSTGADGTVLTIDGNGNLTWGNNAASLQAVTDVGYTTDNPIYQTYATPTFMGLIRDDSQAGGTAQYLNDPRTVQAVGDIAYVISYADGAISSFDISDPTNPVELDTLTDGGSTLLALSEMMEIDGNYAYIMSEDNSLEIVDISDPYNLRHVGSVGVLAGWATALAAGNGYVYIAQGYITPDIVVVDVSDPTAPVVVKSYTVSGSYHIDNPFNMEVDGNYLYVAASASGAFSILDISDPLNATELDYISGITLAKDITTHGNYIYGTSESLDCVYIIDKTDPTNISIVTSVCESTNPTHYELDGAAAIEYSAGYLYVWSGNDNGIAVIDVSSSTAPSYVASIRDTGSIFIEGNNLADIDITDSGLLLQVDDANDTLHVFELPRFVSPAADIGTLSTKNFENTNQAKFYGKVSIGGPLELNNISYYFPGGDGYDGDVLKTDGDGNLTWGYFDTLSIESLTLEGYVCDVINSCPTANEGSSWIQDPHGFFVSGDYAYVAGYSKDSVEIFNISDTSMPVSVGVITSSNLNGAEDIFVAGNYAYVSTYDQGLTILDVSNPTNPTYVAKYTNASYTNQTKGVYVSGKYAYIASYGNNGLLILDISNPSAPTFKGFVASMSAAIDVEVQGDFAYVTAYTGDSVSIIDVSDPTSPTIKGSVVNGVGGTTLLNGPIGIDVIGSYAYVASYDNSAFSIIDITSSTNPVQVGTLADNVGGALLWNARDVKVYGDYAYIASYTDDALEVIDISSSTNPIHVTSYSNNLIIDGAFHVQAANGSVFVVGALRDSLAIYDVPTFTAPSAQIGDLAATNFTVYNDAFLNDDLYVAGSILSGPGGIYSDGDISTYGGLFAKATSSM
ncbi:beta-propeller fold lactonase family protein, partial [Patescibacteria group bacterium]|nr:beta-propeller fold lactonase family protein [Patescibacteria group bacterium]